MGVPELHRGVAGVVGFFGCVGTAWGTAPAFLGEGGCGRFRRWWAWLRCCLGDEGLEAVWWWIWIVGRVCLRGFSA